MSAVNYKGIITLKPEYVNNAYQIIDMIKEVYSNASYNLINTITINPDYFDNYPQDDIKELYKKIDKYILVAKFTYHSDDDNIGWRHAFIDDRWLIQDERKIFTNTRDLDLLEDE